MKLDLALRGFSQYVRSFLSMSSMLRTVRVGHNSIYYGYNDSVYFMFYLKLVHIDIGRCEATLLYVV